MIQFGEHKSFNKIYSPVALFLSTIKSHVKLKRTNLIQSIGLEIEEKSQILHLESFKIGRKT